MGDENSFDKLDLCRIWSSGIENFNLEPGSTVY